MTIRSVHTRASRRHLPALLAVLVLLLVVAVAGPAEAGTGATATLRGRVTGPAGPVAGATVTVVQATTSRTVATGTTDATGTFTIGSLRPMAVKVKISAAGYLATFVRGHSRLATADVLWLKAGRTLSLGTVTLTAEAAIEGSVLADFDPVSFATVQVLDATTGRVLATKVTDSAGQYRIGKLAAGTIKVRASKDGWVTSYASGRWTLADATVYTLVAGRTITQSWDAEMRLFLDLGLPLTPVTTSRS